MIDTVELGRKMMASAATLDDDNEFNQWARLGPLLVSMGKGKVQSDIKSLSTEEQQVVSRALNRFASEVYKVA